MQSLCQQRHEENNNSTPIPPVVFHFAFKTMLAHIKFDRVEMESNRHSKQLFPHYFLSHNNNINRRTWKRNRRERKIQQQKLAVELELLWAQQRIIIRKSAAGCTLFTLRYTLLHADSRTAHLRITIYYATMGTYQNTRHGYVCKILYKQWTYS